MGHKLFFIVVLFLISSIAFSTVDYEIKSGFELNWYYVNDETSPYKNQWQIHRYYGDYNGDNIADYLIALSNPATGDARIFTLDTSATAHQKTYGADKTAGRDFMAEAGTFVPHRLDFVSEENSTALSDLWILGTDAADPAKATENYKKFILQKLDKTNKDFPTIDTFSINVNSELHPVLVCLSYSYNQDTYPDILIYNTKQDSQGNFIISLYSGVDGTLIWTKSLTKDSDEPTTPVIANTTNMGVYPFRKTYNGTASGDFDNDGLPDFLVSYTFVKGSLNPPDYYAACNDITMLNKNGDFLPPYSGWTRIAETPMSYTAYSAVSYTNFNKDNYVDALFTLFTVMGATPPPIFFGYDLKNKQTLFSATNSDFGATPTDLNTYNVMPTYNNTYDIDDVNGDTWYDLACLRWLSIDTEQTRIGLFNAYANNGANKGRKVWLETFPDYNRIFYPVGDFNGDTHCDFGLVMDPSAPETVEAGKITWNIEEYMMGSPQPTAGRSFSYSVLYDFAYNSDNDDFHTFSTTFNGGSNIGGSSVNDYMCIFNYDWDKDDDLSIDKTESAIYAYDGDQSQQQPQTLAEMLIRATNVTKTMLSQYFPAMEPSYHVIYVDNNGDGKYNDIIIENALSTFAVSYPGGGAPIQPSKEKIIQIILGEGTHTQQEIDACDTNQDGYIDAADLIKFILNNP